MVYGVFLSEAGPPIDYLLSSLMLISESCMKFNANMKASDLSTLYGGRLQNSGSR